MRYSISLLGDCYLFVICGWWWGGDDSEGGGVEVTEVCG